MKVVRQKPNNNIIHVSGLSVYSFFLAVCLLLAPSAHAIEFSAIQLFSGFNEPLHAEIEVSGLVDPDAPVVVDVAPPLDHQNYDVPLQYFNAAIDTSWHQEADGRRIIRLTSSLPVSLENLDFLLMVIPADETLLMRIQIPIKQNNNGEQTSQSQLRVQNSNNKNANNLPLTQFNDPLPKRKKKKVRNKQKTVADKRLNRLKRTSELARANRQADANARVLAFNSVADEISYNPYFSKQAITAVLHEDRETDKAEVSIKPALAFVPTTDNKAVDKIVKNKDKSESVNLDVREKLIDTINQLFTMQSSQSDIPASLLDRLLLSTAFPKMNAQTVIKQSNPQIVLSNQSQKTNAKGGDIKRIEVATITPFLSRSLVLSPVGFSRLFQVLARQQFWMKSLQKSALQRVKYSKLECIV